MREQKILNSVVILVVIVSLSASLWVSWLRTPHGAKSGSTAQMSQSVKMSQSVGHTGDPSSSISSSQLVATGHSFYTQACSSCHGNNAQGGYGPNLHGLNLSNTRVATVIKNGITGKMPAFGDKYNAAQQQALVAYVQPLNKKT